MTRSPAEKLAHVIRANVVNFTSFAGAVMVVPVASEPWASITFSGARRRLRIAFDGPGAVCDWPLIDRDKPAGILRDQAGREGTETAVFCGFGRASGL